MAFRAHLFVRKSFHARMFSTDLEGHAPSWPCTVLQLEGHAPSWPCSWRLRTRPQRVAPSRISVPIYYPNLVAPTGSIVFLLPQVLPLIQSASGYVNKHRSGRQVVFCLHVYCNQLALPFEPLAVGPIACPPMVKLAGSYGKACRLAEVLPACCWQKSLTPHLESVH